MTPCLVATTSAMTFANDLPWWLWTAVVLASGIILCLTYWRIWQRTADRKIKWLLILRLLGVAALLVVMAGPVWTRTTTLTSKPSLWLVLDDSASMSLPAAAPSTTQPAGDHKNSTEGISRFEQARQWLTQSHEIRELAGRFELNILSLDGRALLRSDLPARPTQEQTDLSRALHLVTNRARATHSRGIILISDGQDTTGRSSWLALGDLPQPVFTLGYPGLGTDAALTDIALTQMTGPDEALVHHKVTYQLTLERHQHPQAKIPVTLWHADKALASTTVDFPAGALQAHATLSFEPSEPGDFVLEARVPLQPGESNVLNNVRQTRLRVTTEPMRVLYIEGQLRPEFTFLKARLAQDPDINLITFVRTGSASDINPAILSTELLSEDRLKKIDVVLIGDIQAAMLSSTAWDRLARWVTDGGGLMVLGGYHNLLPGELADTPIGPLLPVALNTPDTGRQVNQSFEFKPTPEGLRHPVLNLGEPSGHQASPWTTLPSLGGLVVTGPAKPGATVLARFPRALENNPGNDHGYVVLATQNAGLGRTAILTTDTTWRWSRIARLTGEPDTLYVRFWSQMVRYLARRPVESDQRALSVSTDAPSYDPGSKAVIRIRRNLAASLPQTSPQAQATTAPATTQAQARTDSTSVRLTIRRPDGQTTTLQAHDTSAPGLWTAEFFPDQPGRFEITAQLIQSAPGQPARTLASSSTDMLVQGRAMELQNAAANPAVLEQIARVTHGGYALLSDAQGRQAMLKRLDDTPVLSQQTHRTSVWNNPLFFLLFLSCVSVEWIIRRRHRMM